MQLRGGKKTNRKIIILKIWIKKILERIGRKCNYCNKSTKNRKNANWLAEKKTDDILLHFHLSSWFARRLRDCSVSTYSSEFWPVDFWPFGERKNRPCRGACVTASTFFFLALRFRRFTHHHHHHLRHRFLLRFLLLVQFDDSTDCGSRKRASYALYVAEFGEIWPEIESLNCERAGTGFCLATGSLPKLCSFLQVDLFTKAKLSCLFVYFVEYMCVCMYFCLRLRKVWTTMKAV